MKKTFVTTIMLSIASLNVSAALVNGSTLLIESGSAFNLFGSNSVTGVDSIILGSIQPYDFSAGASTIDTWVFLGANGMHYTSSPTTVIASSGNTAAIDFSGWSWTYNSGLANFDLGAGAWGSNPDGVAEIICGLDCGNGDTYTLSYTATVPESDPNGYAGAQYGLSLIGTVSAVPVPATVWLFMSGLIGFMSFARRCRLA